MVGEWFSNILNDITPRDVFAMMAPEPTKEAVDMEKDRDRMRNPHNDSYKPRIRSRSEIVAELKYRYADAMLEARKVKT